MSDPAEEAAAAETAAPPADAQATEPEPPKGETEPAKSDVVVPSEPAQPETTAPPAGPEPPIESAKAEVPSEPTQPETMAPPADAQAAEPEPPKTEVEPAKTEVPSEPAQSETVAPTADAQATEPEPPKTEAEPVKTEDANKVEPTQPESPPALTETPQVGVEPEVAIAPEPTAAPAEPEATAEPSQKQDESEPPSEAAAADQSEEAEFVQESKPERHRRSHRPRSGTEISPSGSSASDRERYGFPGEGESSRRSTPRRRRRRGKGARGHDRRSIGSSESSSLQMGLAGEAEGLRRAGEGVEEDEDLFGLYGQEGEGAGEGTLEYYFEDEVIEEEQIVYESIFDRLDKPRECLEHPLEITYEALKNISVRLGQIRLCWPKMENVVMPTFMANVLLPDGYFMNTNKERLLLLFAENFRQQYHARYTNRKPLLLAADNIVGQRKFVCSTLRPTTLSSPNLSTWQELASFISDHLEYESLRPPTDLSSRLFAPMTVFSKKKAHAFEMMNVLCSLLLGRNYNAFNVYGFATKDVTEKIMVRTECPFLEEEHVQEVDQEEEEVPKYTLKPPRDLRSKFVMMMEEKELEKKRKAEEKEAEEERQRQLELEKPPYDELYGMRIHGWILMMPHEKDPPDTKPFFIEPSTGMRHELDSPLYCSIQSVWNNVNYYVNLQDDSTSLGNLDYNLKDLTKWEHLLPGEPIEGRRHARNIEIEEDEEALENLHIMDEKHLDMPEPWSLRISIPYSEVATRFPQGKKFTEYKKIKVEQYSPYVQEDGLVLRMFKYNDLDYTELLSIEERYENRSDKLLKILTDVNTGLVTEYFDRGREDNVKIHTYYKEDNEVESWRNLEFNYQSRFDCLQKLECDALYMTEHYIDREDYFYYRHTQYAPRGEPPPGFIEGPRRIILNVVEKFNRNEEVYASDDIATREFDYIGRQMHLKFHYDKGKITQSTRTFLKPPLSEMVEGVAFRPELTYGYQAEIGAKPVKKSKLYSLLQQQMKAEEDCNLKIRYVEDQIAEFLRVRAAETISPTLDVGLFNREQNYHHRLDMLEKERLERTKKEREIEEELDYLKPYLARYKCKEPLNVMAAILVRDKCLEEYKELLVKRANDLQQAFQKHMTWIKSKYEWYKNEVENLVFEEEQEFFKEMGKARFELHCMDIRLHRQKEVWPDKYKALVQWLELHPQLQILKKKVSVDSSN